MLTTTDRAGIRTSLKQWSQRRNIPDEVWNDFIELAISKANRALRIPPLEQFSSLDISDTGYMELPSNFVEAKELKIEINNITILLERKAINEVDDLYNLSNSNGNPCIFGRFGNYLRIAPWSGGDDSLADLYYYAAIPPMTTDSATNWFTEWAPEVLLYGGLSELASYTRDSEGVQMWEGKFRDSIDTLQAMEDRAEWRGSTIAVTLAGSTSIGR
jgi:hypothetical protein